MASRFSLLAARRRRLDDREIEGTDGDDDLRGRSGDDLLSGGPGRDRLFGGFGDDEISGGADDDTLNGGFGDDILNGDAGIDTILGGFGDDRIEGGTGDDILRGGVGDDEIIWNNGDGSDDIDGGAGRDRQIVTTDNDTGNEDVFEISSDRRGIDLARTELNGQTEAGLFALDIRRVEEIALDTGDGSDTVKLADTVIEKAELTLDGGADESGARGFTLVNTVADGTSVDAGGNIADLDAVLQAALEDLIYFNAHSTDFPAGEVRGQLAVIADTRGADGTGTVTFGAVLTGEEEVQDSPVETDAVGRGVVSFTVGPDGVVDYSVSLTVDGVTLDALTVLHLHAAPAGANGPVVVDLLRDGGADPTANGEPGRFDGTAFNANDLGDTLDLSALDLGVFVDLDVENGGSEEGPLSENGAIRNIGVTGGGEETFNATANDFEDAIGTAQDDRLFGNAEINTLSGGAGDDVFHAFGGNDIYDGGEGTDTALFIQAVGPVIADLGVGVALSGLAGDEVNELRSIENFTAGSFDDRVTGSDGANAIDGRGGDDALRGGAGSDRLTGGEGTDSFVFALGEGGDTITDFQIEADRFELDASGFVVDGNGDGVVDGTVAFQNVGRIGEGPDAALDIDVGAGSNVFVLQGTFAGNAQGAADALAEALADNDVDEGAGFFVYFNTNLNVNRLFFVPDLDDVDAQIQQLANLGDAAVDTAALDELALFEADNFTFDSDLLVA
ncbi:MAG: CHRD domain-containing protein [Pseudomonadota bacterium]